MLAFPVNRLASATLLRQLFVMFFSVNLVSVYRAQEPMIGDNGVAARLAFWLRAQTILIALIQCGPPDTLWCPMLKMDPPKKA